MGPKFAGVQDPFPLRYEVDEALRVEPFFARNSSRIPKPRVALVSTMATIPIACFNKKKKRRQKTDHGETKTDIKRKRLVNKQN